MLKSGFRGYRRTPQQERARATIDAIIDAAAQVLDTQGYDAATTNRVAERAGVGVGTVYEYFADKEALTQAVLARCARRKFSRLQQVIEEVRDLSAELAVRRLLEVLIEEISRQVDLTRLLVGRAVYMPAEQEPDEVADAFADLVRGFICRHRQDLPPASIEMATFMVFHSLDAILDAVVLEHPGYLRSPVFIEELAALMGRYLQPNARADP